MLKTLQQQFKERVKQGENPINLFREQETFAKFTDFLGWLYEEVKDND